MPQGKRLGGVALIGVALLLAEARLVLADSFDFETTAEGVYLGGLSIVDSGLTLTITPEGFPNGNVYVIQSTFNGWQEEFAQIDRFAPLRFTFSARISAITFLFSDAGGDDDSPVRISAFNARDTLLTSFIGAYPAGFSNWMTQSLSTPTGASYFIVESTPPFNPYSLLWDIEDVTLVPEPATLTSLGTGLLAVWFARRRKK